MSRSFTVGVLGSSQSPSNEFILGARRRNLIENQDIHRVTVLGEIPLCDAIISVLVMILHAPLAGFVHCVSIGAVFHCSHAYVVLTILASHIVLAGAR